MCQIFQSKWDYFGAHLYGKISLWDSVKKFFFSGQRLQILLGYNYEIYYHCGFVWLGLVLYLLFLFLDSLRKLIPFNFFF